MAAEPERPQGPIEEYLKDLLGSPAYQKFAQNAETLSPPPEPLSLAKSRLVSQDGDNKYTYDLQVSTASFLMVLKTGFDNSSIGISYPSRLTRIDHRQVHPLVTDLINTAYPRGNYTPHVALIGDEREVRLDLSNAWDWQTYELSLPNDSLSQIVYYLNLSSSLMPRALASWDSSKGPDFIYAFMRQDRGWQEFIQMHYNQINYSSKELAQEFLPRNSRYYGGDITQDSEDLANTMRELCKIHPQKTIRYN